MLQTKDIRLYVSTNPEAFNPGNTTAFNITSDFNFTQNLFFTEVYKDIIDYGAPRGVKKFLDGAGEVDFNFDTHLAAHQTKHYSTEELFYVSPDKHLWLGLAGGSQEGEITGSNKNRSYVNFQHSDITYPQPIYIWVEFRLPTGSIGFRFSECLVESASINLSMGNIPKASWRIKSKNVEIVDLFPTYVLNFSNKQIDKPINPKRTILTLDNEEQNLDLNLTGYNITFSNNIEFIVREQIGKNTEAIKPSFGKRTIDGNFSFLMREGKEKDFFDNLLNSTVDESNKKFSLRLLLGGKRYNRIELLSDDVLIDLDTVDIKPLTENTVSFSVTSNNFPFLADYRIERDSRGRYIYVYTEEDFHTIKLEFFDEGVPIYRESLQYISLDENLDLPFYNTTLLYDPIPTYEFTE